MKLKSDADSDVCVFKGGRCVKLEIGMAFYRYRAQLTFT